MDKKLHIISLDIPYPADYGGVIDIFYKLKSLYEAGVEITLHCFQYGDGKQDAELNKYCKDVFYYPRVTGWKGLHTSLPYIISSRKSEELLKNLVKDDAPILFEGIHTTYFANHVSLKRRKKILRAHNIESDYYVALAKNTSNYWKKLYYYFEANRLKLYEKKMNAFDYILSISEKDFAFFQKEYPDVQHVFIPAFHANEEVNVKPGLGKYCLYHGNLSVAENKKSANYLVKEIFSHLNIPLMIAGKNPDQEILSWQNKNIKVIANPDTAALEELIQQAQINVLPSFQQTGLKLKLMHALFIGRHCLVNDSQIETPLRDTVYMAETKELFIEKIKELMVKEFSPRDLESRQHALAFYSNKKFALAIKALL